MISKLTAGSILRQRWSALIVTLKAWPWAETLLTLRQRFREDRLGLTAGSLTFTTTIALVPLFTVMLALFSAFPVFARFRRTLEQQFLQGFVPEAIAKPVLLSLTQFALKASQLGGMGLVALAVTALALMLTIDRTLNAIWRVRTPRPVAQKVLVYWSALTLGPLVLGASLTVTSYLLSASRGLVDELPGGVEFFLGLIVFSLQTSGFAALFRYVPNTHVRWEHAWGGALFVSGALELGQKGLAFYLTQVPIYATIYGAFAAVPIFLVWIFLSWVIVLMGAVIAAYTPSLMSQAKRWPETPGHRFQIALALLAALAAAQHDDRRGLSMESLASLLRADPLQIEPVLDTLVELDWVGRLLEPEAEGGERFVLLCDPDRTRIAPLVGRLLLQPDGFTEGFWASTRLEELTLRQSLLA